MEFPHFNNPFFRESLRPLKPSAQQLRDQRYKPTVEAIQYQRQIDPDYTAPVLPKEGRIQIPVILGRPGDPNRHRVRPVKIDEPEDEYVAFTGYAKQYIDLQLKIDQIREHSAMYPIWAGDNPSNPSGINRKFNEINQQLFSLKKCFVSPEEIMKDNTATIIQRFWRAVFQRRLFLSAIRSVRNYKLRELSGAHRTLSSWMAQMEYSDSRAQQLHYRGVSRVSKLAVKFWQRWSEKEGLVSYRNETKATDQLGKNRNRRNKRLLVIWMEIATGPRSRKALDNWRQSMVPIMKRELEAQKWTVPHEYVELVSSYVSMRSHRSFMFNFFLAWHTKFHSKSLRQTVIERNAFIFYKKKLTTWSFMAWLIRVRKTKEWLGTPDKWARYINLIRAQHLSKMSRVGVIVNEWHAYSRTQNILKQRAYECRRKLTTATFIQWRELVAKHREMKIEAILLWKKAIQDPKITVFRAWNLWALRKRTRRSVFNQLDDSHNQWHNRSLLEQSFGRWQVRFVKRENTRMDIDLQHQHWKLQGAKQETTFLSGLYARDRDQIAAIEGELGSITSQFVANEEEVSKLEELSTTWKIALHAMKMEVLRLSVIVQRCSTAKPERRRRFSNEDFHDRLKNDDRHTQETRSKLSMLQIGNRVIGKWKRRNSDPDLTEEVDMVDIKPPLDENIIQLLSLE